MAFLYEFKILLCKYSYLARQLRDRIDMVLQGVGLKIKTRTPEILAPLDRLTWDVSRGSITISLNPGVNCIFNMQII